MPNFDYKRDVGNDGMTWFHLICACIVFVLLAAVIFGGLLGD